MKKLLTALPLALLAACASHPSGPSGDAGADSLSAVDANGWQALRAKYMDCVQKKANDNLSAKGQSKDVADLALSACQPELDAMHESFRTYLDAQMSSSHGKSSARQAAARVTTDTREKARSYLVRYVERERYLARQP
jgi:DnaJ-domain-containing protein 1